MKDKLNDPAQAADYFKAKLTFTTGPVEVGHGLEENANINIVDVRAAEDYAAGHIPTAVSLPSDQWETEEGMDKNKLNVFCCYNQQCHLAAQAGLFFARKGYSVMEMDGGWKSWRGLKLPTEK
jgi:rhodanese-related sulfurtransferase